MLLSWIMVSDAISLTVSLLPGLLDLVIPMPSKPPEEHTGTNNRTSQLF